MCIPLKIPLLRGRGTGVCRLGDRVCACCRHRRSSGGALSSMTVAITSRAAATATGLSWGVLQADARLRLVLPCMRWTGDSQGWFSSCFVDCSASHMEKLQSLLPSAAVRVGQGVICDKIGVVIPNSRVCARAFNSVPKKNLLTTGGKTLG